MRKLASLTLAGLVITSVLPAGAGTTNRLNVLFLVSDDLRPELGCYGNTVIRSPNIDRLARRGMVFNRAYCQQAVCSPSRTSLLTGARPDTTKVWDLRTHFRKALPDVVTLPQLFKNHGYVSLGMGKVYHGGLDDPPSWSTHAAAQVAPDPDNTQPKNPHAPKKSKRDCGKRGPAFRASDDPPNGGGEGALADEAIAALRKFKTGAQPFFLAVGFHKPHLPFVAPKAYWDLYDPEKIPLAPNPFLPQGAPAYALPNRNELWSYSGVPDADHLPDDYARQLKHGYYAAVSYMDAQVGRILDELERLGLRETTIVILWGDHGWKLGEHDRWCKHSNVENDARAPLLLSVPGMKTAGRATDALVEFVDIYPTLAELAGLPLPAHLEGTSFKPLLDDPKRPWKPAAFSQYPRKVEDRRLMSYSMRTDRYRFTRWVDREDHSKVHAVELYDHRTDPQENINIAGEPANQALVEKLTRLWLAGTSIFAAAPSPVHQATGIKICEVDTNSAIVWTRLTKNAEQLSVNGPLPTITYAGRKRGKKQGRRPDQEPVVEFPADLTVDMLQAAAPGSAGQTRVLYRARRRADWESTPWQGVDADRDFTRQHHLQDLTAGTTYEIRVEGRPATGAAVTSTVEGSFRTAPNPDQAAPVRFTVITGQNYYDRDLKAKGWKIYPEMLERDPDFFVHTGDILYYDGWAKSLSLARWMWQQVYGMPTNVRFHRQVASYFIKDDHDTWMNDCWPTMKTSFMGDFTFAQGQAVFLEQVGMGGRTFRTFRWGRDLQIWLPEGRDFRSPNNMPDGPAKTIWGAQQKAWFKRTVQASDATFRVLISPTPLVGPDRGSKNDSHANKGFTHEGEELRTFCARQKNMVVVCGDRHWQYVSVAPKTGLREYSCGPATDAHAGGWPKDRKEPQHLYLGVVGGFLEGEVRRIDGIPTLTFRHYSVDGKCLNVDVLRAKHGMDDNGRGAHHAEP